MQLFLFYFSVNGLEEEQENDCNLKVKNGKIYFNMKPFQILSLKLYLSF